MDHDRSEHSRLAQVDRVLLAPLGLGPRIVAWQCLVSDVLPILWLLQADVARHRTTGRFGRQYAISGGLAGSMAHDAVFGLYLADGHTPAFGRRRNEHRARRRACLAVALPGGDCAARASGHLN